MRSARASLAATSCEETRPKHDGSPAGAEGTGAEGSVVNVDFELRIERQNDVCHRAARRPQVRRTRWAQSREAAPTRAAAHEMRNAPTEGVGNAGELRSTHAYACNKCMRMSAVCGGASRAKAPGRRRSAHQTHLAKRASLRRPVASTADAPPHTAPMRMHLLHAHECADRVLRCPSMPVLPGNSSAIPTLSVLGRCASRGRQRGWGPPRGSVANVVLLTWGPPRGSVANVVLLARGVAHQVGSRARAAPVCAPAPGRLIPSHVRR